MGNYCRLHSYREQSRRHCLVLFLLPALQFVCVHRVLVAPLGARRAEPQAQAVARPPGPHPGLTRSSVGHRRAASLALAAPALRQAGETVNHFAEERHNSEELCLIHSKKLCTFADVKNDITRLKLLLSLVDLLSIYRFEERHDSSTVF